VQLVKAEGLETTLTRVALGLIGLHFLDDNFVQPQPGTSAADHLVSGLVPLALLLLFALAYPRLRGGLRGTLAIVLGVFATVMGAGEAGYYALQLGPSADDYTGFLALAAGLLLIGVGATTLWKTRRREGSAARRYVRRVLLAVVAFVGAYLVLMPLSLSYVFTHAARAVVPRAELGAAYEQVAFETADGLTLKGWYVPSRNSAAVIAAPGRAGSQKPARMLVRHGYGVLLFDRRGEGESQGDPNAFGWNASTDMRAAVAFLQHRPDVELGRIGGIGLSVGAETLLQTAAESNGLKAIVSDGAGARSIREDVTLPGWRNWSEVPTSFVVSAGTAFFSNRLPPPNLEGLVRRIAPRPLLFIYGQRDQPNVRALTPIYYKAAREPKALWRIAGAGHTGGIDTQPRQYERRVVAFFDRALLGSK
jgi:alpha/beta superfamily hydrolase